MRLMILSGRIATKASVSKSKNGNRYVAFRFANEEFDEKDNVYWFRIVSFDPCAINKARYLTVGKPVNIIGKYQDEILKSKKNGKHRIARTIIADRIEFEIGKSFTTKEKKKPKEKTDEQPKLTTDDDSDDFPF